VRRDVHDLTFRPSPPVEKSLNRRAHEGQRSFPSSSLGNHAAEKSLHCNDFQEWPGAGSNRQPCDFQPSRADSRPPQSRWYSTSLCMPSTHGSQGEPASKGRTQGRLHGTWRPHYAEDRRAPLPTSMNRAGRSRATLLPRNGLKLGSAIPRTADTSLTTVPRWEAPEIWTCGASRGIGEPRCSAGWFVRLRAGGRLARRPPTRASRFIRRVPNVVSGRDDRRSATVEGVLT
jgi:hypothetical protein